MGDRRHIPDSLLQLKDAGLVAASAAATVGGAAAVIDLGGDNTYTFGMLLLDVSAIEADTGEAYRIVLEGSNATGVGTPRVNLAEITLGDVASLPGDTKAGDSGVGLYRIPFHNELLGTTYRYVRIYTTVVGTPATGINFTARLSNYQP